MKIALLSSLSALLLVSCQTIEFHRNFGKDAPNQKVTVTRTTQPVVIDANFNEKAWSKTPAYQLEETFYNYDFARTPKRTPLKPVQKANVKFLCDKENLYLAVQLDDPDIMQTGMDDQTKLFLSGDTVEFFIKSKRSDKYMEIYATPNNKRTTLFFLTRGYPKVDDEKPYEGYKTAVKVFGTFNNHDDKDNKWIVEAAIPVKMLEQHTGVPFNAEGQWTIQVARYNYDMGNHNSPEYTALPKLPVVNYHLWEYFADMIFADEGK